MKRYHLIEIEDQPWCPAPIRDGATDYLQFVVAAARPYNAIAARLNAAIERCGTRQVTDLCAGAGGPWLGLLAVINALREGAGSAAVKVCLTDRYPNRNALEQVKARSGGQIDFEAQPVDAARVPPGRKGFRTLFSGFHHFPPGEAVQILGDAVSAGEGIAVFELIERKIPTILGMLVVPFFILMVTPAIRPFRWSRLLFTYLLPAIPLVGLVDGVVSCLRAYTLAELEEMVRPFSGYDWETGQQRVPGLASPVTYLIGTPRLK